MATQDEFIRLDCPRCGAPLQMEGETLSCEYCRARLILKRPLAGVQGQTRNIPASGTVVGGFTLMPFAYYDYQSSLEAFSMLVPRGWQVTGGVTWVIERPAAPAEIGLQLVNPNGLETFELHPNLYFAWTTNMLIAMTKPAGSHYFGFEVRQPMPARTVMRQFVLPRRRNILDLAIVDEGPAMELQQAIMSSQPPRPQGSFSVDSARVRLHYSLNGQPVAEELSCLVENNRIGGDMIHWNVAYCSSFRSSREILESYADLYRAIFSSIKINPSWGALVQQVIQGLSSNQIRFINDIGVLSGQIARNADQMRESNLRGWQERSESYDRAADQFSQTMRGVDSYFDPNKGERVELPAGYSQAWSTPLGDYVLSEELDFNPNIGSNQTWTPLEPGKP